MGEGRSNLILTENSIKNPFRPFLYVLWINSIIYMCCNHVSQISWVTFHLAWERCSGFTYVHPCMLLLRTETVIIVWGVFCVWQHARFRKVNVRLTTFTPNPWNSVSTVSSYISPKPLKVYNITNYHFTEVQFKFYDAKKLLRSKSLS